MNRKLEMIKLLLKGDLSTEQKRRTIGVVLESENTKERAKIFDELIRGGELTQHQLEEIAPTILLNHDESDWGKEENHAETIEAPESIEQKVTRMLHELGIPAHLKGYQYLREAIMLGVDDVSILDRVTKTLYPTVAKRFQTTPSRVERAIRHAIEVSWSQRGDVEYMEEYFGFSVNPDKGKPTNSEFIATLVDWICFT